MYKNGYYIVRGLVNSLHLANFNVKLQYFLWRKWMTCVCRLQQVLDIKIVIYSGWINSWKCSYFFILFFWPHGWTLESAGLWALLSLVPWGGGLRRWMGRVLSALSPTLNRLQVTDLTKRRLRAPRANQWCRRTHTHTHIQTETERSA